MFDRVVIWGVMVIIVREFLVIGVWFIVVEYGKVIVVSYLGKYKILIIMLVIIMFLFNDFGLIFIYFNLVWMINIVYYIVIFFMVWFGFDYLYKNREIILESV